MGIIVVYLVIVAGILFWAWVIWDDETEPESRRTVARIALLAPIWPALIVYALIIGVRALWHAAEWGKK